MTKILVVLSSALVKEGIQNIFGEILPIFIPVGSEKLLNKQLAELSALYDKKIVTVPKGYTLDQSDELLLNRLDVAKIILPDGLSLDQAIKQTLDYISLKIKDFDITFLMGDTLIVGIQELVLNSFSIHLPISEGCWFKHSDSSKKVFSGMLTVKYELIKKFMETTNEEIISNSFFELLKPSEVGSWYDFGHIYEYSKNRFKVDTSRVFNTIEYRSNSIIKRSNNREKLVKELFWYQNLPEQFNRYVPKLIDSNEFDWYELERLDITPLNEIAVNGRLGIDAWKNAFEKLKDVLEDFQKYSINSHFNYHEFIVNKTEERIKDIGKNLHFIDHELTNSFLSRVDKLRLKLQLADEFNIELNLYPDTKVCFSHGDFCFSNIFYDFTNSTVKLIDPRGTTNGLEESIFNNPSYDLVKLAHSVYGYDLIISGNFSINEEGIVKMLYPSHWHDLTRSFEEVFIGQGDQFQRSLLLNLAHLFLSMIPLHSDFPKRQLAFLYLSEFYAKECLPC